MSVIVEVHTVEEAEKSLNFKEALIGINNRNLKTLKTDINTTYDIHNVLIKHQGPLISESGIKTKDELMELKNKTSIKTFLIQNNHHFFQDYLVKEFLILHFVLLQLEFQQLFSQVQELPFHQN